MGSWILCEKTLKDLFFSDLRNVSSLQLRAFVSSQGLHGEITFTQNADKSISLKTQLAPTLEYPSQVWTWSVVQFPVDYTNLENRCGDLGKTTGHSRSFFEFPRKLCLARRQTMGHFLFGIKLRKIWCCTRENAPNGSGPRNDSISN